MSEVRDAEDDKLKGSEGAGALDNPASRESYSREPGTHSQPSGGTAANVATSEDSAARPAPESPSLPPIPDHLHTPWTRLEAACERYIDGYELRDAEDADGNCGDYTPSYTERMLITDCLMGLLCDDEIIALIRALPEGA